MNQIRALTRWWAPPVLDSDERTARASTLTGVVLIILGVGILFLALMVWSQPETLSRRAGSAAFLVALGAFVQALNRAGRIRLGSWILVAGFYTLLLHRAFTSGGISAPQSNGFLIVVLLAGVLLGTRAGALAGVIAWLGGLAMFVAERSGALPPPAITFTPTVLLLFSGIWIALAVLLQALIARTLWFALRRARKELARRELAQARLQKSFKALRASEGRLATIFRESPTALTLSDRETGRLIDVNEAFLRFVGASSFDQVLGKTIIDLGILTPATRDKLIGRLVDGRVRGFILEGRRLDGTECVGEASVSSYEVSGRGYLIASIADVTERTRFEEERLRAERAYREVVDGVRDVVFVLTPDGVITALNPAFDELTGLSASEWIGRPFFELIHPDDMARAMDEMGSAVAGFPADTPPIRVRKSDGSYMHAEVNVAPRIEDGRTVSVFGIGRDVSERMALEEARAVAEREREASLVALGERVKELKILHETTRILQREWDDLPQLLTIWAMQIPEAWRFPECCEARVELGDFAVKTPGWRRSPWSQSIRFETELGPGSIEVVYLEPRPEADEGPFFAEERSLLESLRDLLVSHVELHRYRESLEDLVETRTEELRIAKEAVERANVLSESALDLTKSGYWQIALSEPKWVHSSERLVRMHGDAPSPDLRYRVDGWMEGVVAADPKAANAVFGSFEAALAGEIPTYDATYAFERRDDGRIVWFHTKGQVVRDAEGKPTHMYGVSQDITAFKRLEAEFTAAKNAADRANEAKSTFLATMSHEIRTPMNAILGYAQLLRRDPSLTGEQRRQISVILTSGDHLLFLINNVLEMSKIEAGRVTLVTERVDLPALLDGVHQMFAGLARAKHLDLGFETNGLVRSIDADAGKVRQVVINLLSNAVKFTPAGGRITVRAISAPALRGRHRVSIEVQDTGEGMAPEDVGRIFEAFEQLGLGARTGGTGLGLAISRQFARLMEGDVTAESASGAGSTFRFTFLASASAEGRASPGRGRLPVGLAEGQPQPKILVVDDQATNREVAAELVTRIGFAARTAASGEEAINLHDEWRPDLVLMDLKMPGIDGIETIRRLRTAGSRAALVLFTASSIGMVETRRKAVEAGADDLLMKPYREEDLFDRIEQLLGVRYTYEEEAPPFAPGDEGAERETADLLAGLPDDLLDELREAAMQARAARVADVAARAVGHSAAAAERIRTLALDFRYDAILAALGAGRPS